MTSNPQLFTASDDLLIQLDQVLKKHSESKLGCGLCLLEVSSFRKVRSTLGFDTFKEFIEEIKSRLVESLPYEDSVFQISESTFGIVVQELMNKDHIILALEKFRRVMNEPVETGDRSLTITCHIGAALDEMKSNDADTLFHKAEFALSVAEEKHLTYQVYSTDLKDEEIDRLIQSQDLHQAIRKGELDVYYQPKICLAENRLCGIEALVRWEHREYGWIPPSIFVPIAERTGICHELTEFVLKTAFRDYSLELCQMFETLSINLSVLDLADVEIISQLQNLYSIWNVAPERTLFEITESAFMEDQQFFLEKLNRLKQLGCLLSIDDFGTGYSSLAYFKSIPASELKIDRSFIYQLAEEPVNRRIVEIIIQLAQRFDMKVCAEGVEDFESLTMLRELGCELVQGYHYCKPLSKSELIEWAKSSELTPK